MIDELAQQAVWHSRRWTTDTLTQLGVDFDGERFTIPIHHGDGTGHVERYAPPGMRNGTERKMLAPAGARRDLFPPPEQAVGSYLFLVEGAPAALTVHSAGLEAIAVPSSSGWRPEWAPRLAGRDVIVTPDAEPAGRAAFARIAEQLLEHANTVRIFDPYPGQDDGRDIGDLIAELVPPDQPDRISQTGAQLLAHALDQPPLQPPPPPEPDDPYRVTFTTDKPPKLVLPPIPAREDRTGLCLWLTSVFRLDPQHPVTGGIHEGATTRGSGHVELTRAGDAPDLRFEPASVLTTGRRLIETLLWQQDAPDGDQEPYGFKDDHARRIAYVVKLLCGRRRGPTAKDETAGIIATFAFSAIAVEGHTVHGTSPERYEAAAALRQDLDGQTGRAIGPPRYLIDANTGEIMIRVSDLQAAARAYTGTSLAHGWLDARMEGLGWERVTLDAHAIPGREGRGSPHVRAAVYRGHLPADDGDQGDHSKQDDGDHGDQPQNEWSRPTEEKRSVTTVTKQTDIYRPRAYRSSPPSRARGRETGGHVGTACPAVTCRVVGCLPRSCTCPPCHCEACEDRAHRAGTSQLPSLRTVAPERQLALLEDPASATVATAAPFSPFDPVTGRLAAAPPAPSPDRLEDYRRVRDRMLGDGDG